MLPRVFLVVGVVLLCGSSFGAYIGFFSTHNCPVEFRTFLESKGHYIDASYFSSIPFMCTSCYDLVIVNCEGTRCPTWDSSYQSAIESVATYGGVVLYIGRGSLENYSVELANTLGFISSITFGLGLPGLGAPITSDPICNPLTNGYYQDLRGVVPSTNYPRWVANHFHELESVDTNVLSGDVAVCLPNSSSGGNWAFWTVRSLGPGAIVWMSVSTYVLDEFWIRGFYQAALLNLLGFATTGIVYGDPHVVTLAREKFEMPTLSFDRIFNFYSSYHLSVRAKLSNRPEWGGLWVTEIGVRFIDQDEIHHLHCYISDNDVGPTFTFDLDGEELENPRQSGSWEYLLNNDAMIGSWHNMKEFSSPGMFRLETEDGSMITVQAVTWKNAPSFSFEVHKGPTPHQMMQTRTLQVETGLLQHSLEAERDPVLQNLPNIFLYQKEELLPFSW